MVIIWNGVTGRLSMTSLMVAVDGVWVTLCRPGACYTARRQRRATGWYGYSPPAAASRLEAPMHRYAAVATVVAVIAGAAPVAQEGNAGGSGIRRGAAQANQNRWNAKSPWGGTERSGPIPAQKKAAFRIFDNVHYVGLQTVSTYLVSTSAGLVLIDSGYGATTDWLIESIRTAGFNPEDVRYILVTHSHADHAGGAGRLRQLTGARVGMSAEDWTLVERQQADPQQQRNFPVAMTRDLVLKDGDALTVGETTFRFHFTPGHTAGSTSIEFPARDGGRAYRALTPGGLGLHYQPEWGPTFRTSIQRLKDRGPWDVMLSNHPFLMPKDLEAIEAALQTRGSGPHPAVLGPAAIDGFWNAVLAIVDEKLVVEPPTRPLPAR
jgi:metallo-beta-lactamase class B